MSQKERKDNSNKNIGSKFLNTLMHFFIPHEDNEHKPIIIRPTALKIYSVILIITKVFVTAFLFLAYPSPAHFGNVTSSSIVDLTNSARQESGLVELKTSESLNLAAYQKAQDMINNDYFSHQSPSGSYFWNWILDTGYQYTTAGENLAMDFTSAQSVHNALMDSGSHRKNIMNPNFTEIGVSVVSGTINNRNTTILVQLFGNPQLVVTEAPVQEEIPPQEETTPPAQEEAAPTKTTQEQEEETISPPPFFKAEVTGQSNASLNLLTDSKKTFWVDIKNTGNTTWVASGDNFVALNLTDPTSRISPFEHSSWLYTYRPTKLAKDQVLPSESARFEFQLKAPSEAGEFQEAFQLVAENLTWIEGSHFTIPITVTAPVIENVNTEIAAETNENQNQNLNTNLNKEVYVVTITNTNEQITSELEENIPIVVASSNTKSQGFVDYLIDFSQKIFWFLLIFITVSLLINIFVRVKIQHVNTIISTLFVILIATLMLVSRFHFIENIISKPVVL